MHQPRTGLVVADRSRARILVRHGSGELEELKVLSAPTRIRGGADTRGRVFESVGGARHAIEPRVGRSALARSSFAAEVAEAVNVLAAQGAFHQLVLAAPAPMLGALERRLSEKAKAILVQAFSKDLTKEPRQALRERLARAPV